MKDRFFVFVVNFLIYSAIGTLWAWNSLKGRGGQIVTIVSMAILIVILSGCATSTTVHPDGSVTTTESVDPFAVALFSAALADMAEAQIHADK